MNSMDLSLILAALAAGLAVGLAYFLGLWWTVRRLPGARRPWLLAPASLILRSGLAMAAFHLVSGGDWRRLAACLAGFTLARLALARRLRPGTRTGQEAA